jgi:hypothetical protein
MNREKRETDDDASFLKVFQEKTGAPLPVAYKHLSNANWNLEVGECIFYGIKKYRRRWHSTQKNHQHQSERGLLRGDHLLSNLIQVTKYAVLSYNTNHQG